MLAALALVTSRPSSTLRSPSSARGASLASGADVPRTKRLIEAGADPGQAVRPAASEVAITPPPEEFDQPAAAPAPPPQALRATASVPATGGVWAVLVGIDDYPGSRSDLRASVADANEVDAALAGYGVPQDRRLLLRNTQATAATIGDSLRWLVSHASADATVVFFYAGHVRKVSSRTEAIVAADGRILTDAAMASLLRPLAAQRVWITMASCYGGGFDELLAPGRILTGAAGAQSLAYENSTFGHSYLVEYMIHRAMNQRQAPSSVERAFAWAADALRRDYPNRMPVEVDQLDGELQLGPAPPQAAPMPPPKQPSGGGNGGGSGGQPPPSDPGTPPPDDDPCLLSFGSLVGCG